MSRTHSPWGASAAHRWMNCPGSIRSCLNSPQQTSSPYALEGRAAHFLAAECIKRGWDVLDRIGRGMTVPPDGPDAAYMFEVTEEMAEAVACYLDYVLGLPGSRLVEERLDMDWFHPGMYGTADYIAHDSDRNEMWVIDYKHGKGVEVDSENNAQLHIYALGAVKRLFWPKKDTTVHLVIVQPRAGKTPIREEILTVGELLEWARKVLKPALAATLRASAPRITGDWCRFCPVLESCPEARDRACALAKIDFGDPDPASRLVAPSQMPLEDLGRVFAVAKAIEQWIGAVVSYATKRALEGETVPGCKLVPIRAMRKWVDESQALEGLQACGIDPWERKLVSVAEAERRLKKEGKELPKDLSEKKSSGYRLVVEEDPRPKVSDHTLAELEFGAIETEM